MQQVIQSVRTGKMNVAVLPDPLARPGQVLIANACSLISAGTEKMAMDLARKSLLGKARERPDHVRRALQKIRQEGLLSTITQIKARLDEPMPMGYSSAGIVLACGAGVQEFKPGDRVASNGPHAGVVCVPRHLCAHLPESVSFEQGAFGILGAIALQGVRLAELHLGETVLVVGLGLIGQLAVALLKAQGCRVLGADPQADRCTLALRMGADEASPGLTAESVMSGTRGLGADAVLITAAAKSNEPVRLAADAVRKKGRIVLVGVADLELDRRAFYFKEAEFVVSCSYGPGRYDPVYEERGHDYPPAYVRWTEQRNLQAVLDLMGSGRLDVAPLITHRFPIERGEDAYRLIEQGTEPFMGVLLTYPDVKAPSRKIEMSATSPSAGKIGFGLIGSGQFARAVLLPALQTIPQFEPRVICSAGGLSSARSSEKYGFQTITSDEKDIISAKDVQAVLIATRHDQHASQVISALQAGKHVFVEKPLCLSLDELAAIEEALLGRSPSGPSPILMVGFNRRFSKSASQVKQIFAGCNQPMTISIRFNAGSIPAEHWTQDEEVGGGRIIGEACHAIDLATFLAGSLPVRVFAESVGGPKTGPVTDDQCFITLRHANGSVSSIAYLSGGDRVFPKERIEVLGGGRMAVIDDFREVSTAQGGKIRKERFAQDKGHRAELEAFARTLLSGGPSPISWEEIRAVTRASLLAVQSLREGIPFDVP